MQYPLFKIILSDFINPKSDKSASLIRQGAIVLKRVTNKSGQEYKIIELGKEKNILKKYYSKRSIEVVELTGMICLPSFFDMHFHWVQDDVCLKPKASLLNWLKKYTWPYEAKFKNKNFSKKRAADFTKLLTQVGTLGGACYSSIHQNALEDGFKHFIGDFIIGNVLMTINSPKYLTLESNKTINLVKKMLNKYGKCYALTPRFAITVDPKVMKETAKLTNRKKAYIQTHLSETQNEINTVLEIFRSMKGFEKIKTYTEVYDKCNLVTDRSIFGHGIHLSDEELKLLKKKKSWIAHCPTSNAPIKEKGLGSGLFDFRKTEKMGVEWALASDIGGGPYLSMFDVMESFVSQNKRKKIKEATYTKALYRSTLKSAEFLKLDKAMGNLEVGKFANLLFVDSPKEKKNETAELVLKEIISKHKNDRKKYNDMVFFTLYKGNEVYNSRVK